MTKTLTAVVAHILVVVALLTTFGILGLARNESEGADKFTGELERNVKLRVSRKRHQRKKWDISTNFWTRSTKNTPPTASKAEDANMDQYIDRKRTVRTVTVPISYIKRTTL